MSKKPHMNGFDLSAYDAMTAAQSSGIPIEILNPVTGEPLGVTVVLAGQDGKQAKSADRVDINQRIKGRKIKAVTALGLEESTRRKLAACILSWTGMIDGGKPLECTPENVYAILVRAPWLESQLADAVTDREGFFTN